MPKDNIVNGKNFLAEVIRHFEVIQGPCDPLIGFNNTNFARFPLRLAKTNFVHSIIVFLLEVIGPKTYLNPFNFISDKLNLRFYQISKIVFRINETNRNDIEYRMKLYKIHDKFLDPSRSNSDRVEFAGGVEKDTPSKNKLIKVATLFKKKKVNSKWQVQGLNFPHDKVRDRPVLIGGSLLRLRVSH